MANDFRYKESIPEDLVVAGPSSMRIDNFQILDPDVRIMIFENVFKPLPRRDQTALLVALRGHPVTYSEALKSYYKTNQVLMSINYTRTIHNPLPTSPQALSYIKNLIIRHNPVYGLLKPTSNVTLQTTQALKLMPKVIDVRYAHFDCNKTLIAQIKLIVEVFSLRRLQVDLSQHKHSLKALEQIETCLGMESEQTDSRFIEGCKPPELVFVWEIPKGEKLVWRDEGHLDGLDDIEEA